MRLWVLYLSMPFTFFHPGFVLPLKKRWPHAWDSTGLVMGSIAPDMDIIFRISHMGQHIFDYSTANIWLMIIPIAIAMALYTHLVILPLWRKRITSGYWIGTLLTIIISCIAGVYAHLAVDHLTHFNGNDIVTDIDRDTHIPYRGLYFIYLLISYLPLIISSLLGAWLIYRYVGKKKLKTVTLFIFSTNYRFLVFNFAVAFTLFFMLKILISGIDSRFWPDGLVITGTSAMLLAFFTLPLYYRLSYKQGKAGAGI